jgi:uncharacterized protein (DUF4415 family)
MRHMVKVPITVTIDEEILNNFRRMCENNDIKMSTKINSLIKDWMETKNK